MRYAWLLVIAACGFPPLPNQNPDHPDAGSNTGPDAPGPAKCLVPQTYGTPPVTSQEGFFLPAADPQNDPDAIIWDANISNPDVLFVYLFAPGPQFPNGFVPKTIAISGDETNFSTCSGCVLIGAQCNSCAPEQNNNGQYFMATGGSLKITQVSNTKVTGTLTNVTFTHVTVQNQGTDPSLLTTPVNDNCTTRIDSVAFTSTLTQQ